eukprot:TRINITY_DN2762_c0_g1_i1.p1 TRINITY_DN2762_c0_g1~~TRINITY_DN2762_c0_g1_i1.p1  ORF type:complete len:259 (+),score=81.07 TRINITY_DN2762_c0_g1_i1:65-841(+)
MGKKTKKFADQEECAECGEEFDIDHLVHLGGEDEGGLCAECRDKLTCTWCGGRVRDDVCEACNAAVPSPVASSAPSPVASSAPASSAVLPAVDNEWAVEPQALETRVAALERRNEHMIAQLRAVKAYLVELKQKEADSIPPCEGKCEWCLLDTARYPYCGVTGRRHISRTTAKERIIATRQAYPIDPVDAHRFPLLNSVLQIAAFGDVMGVSPAAVQDAKAWLTVYLLVDAGFPPKPPRPSFAAYCFRPMAPAPGPYC